MHSQGPREGTVCHCRAEQSHILFEIHADAPFRRRIAGIGKTERNTEMKKELPKGWVETELHVVAEILDNLRKPVNSTGRRSLIGNIPYYGATGQAGWIDDYLFDEELVLVGEDGAPFLDKTKNVAYLINGKSWVNNHAHVLKAISKISSNKFLLHFLNQFDYKDFVGGTTRLKLTQGDLKVPTISPSPLPEQLRIVAKLDTLFGQLDKIKTHLERIHNC